jgi:predicted metal-dependent phosphoesterase TrpH
MMKADLHIHTCLSPCGDLDMTPRKIAARAADLGLSIIAVCDHHSIDNFAAVSRASVKRNVFAIPGMEVSTREEAHVVALFESSEKALEFQRLIYDNLPPGENDEKLFGEQLVANENDELEGYNRRLLIAAVDLPLSRIIREIHERGGIAVASHIDRESFSVIQQLGFIPDDLEFDALEISSRMSLEKARETYKDLADHTFITSSDAHFLDEIGNAYTSLLLEKADFNEIKMALSNIDGRRVLLSEN